MVRDCVLDAIAISGRIIPHSLGLVSISLGKPGRNQFGLYFE